MAIFSCSSREFQDWLNGMEHERGFSKVLAEAADFRVSSQVHTIINAESLLGQFLVLKDDASYVVFSFRSMTYLFKGSRDEVEAKVRGLPLGRLKLPARKALVKSIAEHLMSIIKEIRTSNEAQRTRANGIRKWVVEEMAKPVPNMIIVKRDTDLADETEKGVIPEPCTPREIRDYLKGPNQWLHGKAWKQLEYYLYRDDVKDDVIQDALNIVLAQDVLMS